MADPDDEKKEAGIRPSPDNVCVCFHVPLCKIEKHLRLENPRVASQLSDCYGAGTGCGWCIPFLEQLFEQWEASPTKRLSIGLSTGDYLERRKAYLKKINASRMREVEQELGDCDDLIRQDDLSERQGNRLKKENSDELS